MIESGDKSDMAQPQQISTSLSPQRTRGTLIIAGTMRNDSIRSKPFVEARNKQDGWENPARLFSSSPQLEYRAKASADWYRKGDYVRLLQTSKTASIKRGELYKVERREGDELVVSSFGGRLYRFKPAKYKLRRSTVPIN
ncbi:hypothetical protein [Acaryochloris sp. CCMEE 5410]|uniref:hypothetical protein n=1 Tax=Acaryochloris sp. CCMEE 5410 TaxID=310037 RepID=UPI0021CEA5BB|nr:hypothetical protein [Acaryochloris sp. CCMEE 5410]